MPAVGYDTSNVSQLKQSTCFKPLVYSLLHFGIMHVYDGVSGVSLSLLEMARPHVVHPVNEVHLDKREKGK